MIDRRPCLEVDIFVVGIVRVVIKEARDLVANMVCESATHDQSLGARYHTGYFIV